MKFYAVKNGRKIGIFTSWDECKEQVNGFLDADYKSFNNIEDANNYLNDIKNEFDSNVTKAYVDGSYNEKTNEYSFGVVLLHEGKEFP